MWITNGEHFMGWSTEEQASQWNHLLYDRSFSRALDGWKRREKFYLLFGFPWDLAMRDFTLADIFDALEE